MGAVADRGTHSREGPTLFEDATNLTTVSNTGQRQRFELDGV